jgi:hypothetical protein
VQAAEFGRPETEHLRQHLISVLTGPQGGRKVAVLRAIRSGERAETTRSIPGW